MSNENLFVEAGARIRAIRGNATQSEFAERLGVNRKTVERWEAGERLPEGQSLLALMTVFYADINYILTGIDSAAHGRLAIQQGAIELAGKHVDSFEEKKRLGSAISAQMHAAVARLPLRERTLLDNYRQSPESGKKLIEGTAAMAARSKRDTLAREADQIMDVATGQLRPGAQTKPDADGISVRVPLPEPKAVKRKTRTQTINAPVSVSGKKV